MKQSLLIYLALVGSAVLVAYLINVFVNRAAKRTNHSPQERAYVLYKTILFVVTGYVLSSLSAPLMVLWEIIGSSGQNGFLLTYASYAAASLVIALTCIMLVYVVGYLLFFQFYQKKKLASLLAADDIYAVLILGGLFVLGAIITREMLPHIVDNIVPYPKIPEYR